MQLQLTPYGYCECGCGQKTKVPAWNDRSKGWVKGRPVRFIRGHSGKHLQGHVGPKYEVRDCGHTTPCWVWVLATDCNGYGRLGGGPLAHVAQWEALNGPVPPGLELDHLCRNTSCVNPAHLDPVTHAENLRRGKGAKLTAENVRTIRLEKHLPNDVLAQRFGVSADTVRNVISGRTWKDVV